MAEVQTDSPDKSGGNPRAKKRSTKVDMTAMVDVAFLLLTFFILTTTLASPAAMHIPKPKPDGTPPTEIVDDKILTLIPYDEGKLLYFHGLPEMVSLRSTHYGPTGLRQVIMNHLQSEPTPCPDPNDASCWDPIFIVKPHPRSTYGQLVDVLDELQITDAKKFSFQPLQPVDSMLLADAGW